MNLSKTISVLLAFFLWASTPQTSNACSMYKVTSQGKTMVGCNEDAWRSTSSIWFENAINQAEYGAAFTGSRKVGDNKFAPQSGMNTAGLVFSRLASSHPKQGLNVEGLKTITNDVEYLSQILHQCASIQEVKEFIEAYDHSFFLGDVFIYVDKSGDYLVVEPYSLIEGNDPSYVLSNFCPTLTSKQNARKLERFKNGEDFVKTNGIGTSLQYCKALSDTMHVCRKGKGDGTLLTTIWNPNQGEVNIFFYHNFDTTVQFNLVNELAKGDHIISNINLFPENLEFQSFQDYINPFTVPIVRVLLVLLAGVLGVLSLLELINHIKSIHKHLVLSLVLIGVNILLIWYMFVLATNEYIFYFEAPFKHYSSTLISVSSYIPFVLLVVIIPVLILIFRLYKSKDQSNLSKFTVLLNTAIYGVLIFAFAYWGLYNVI